MAESTPCPICQRACVGVDPALLPFCSVRCRQVDLYRWFGGKYAIASPITDPEILEELADRAEQGEFEDDT